jgi:hypothetical protein
MLPLMIVMPRDHDDRHDSDRPTWVMGCSLSGPVNRDQQGQPVIMSDTKGTLSITNLKCSSIPHFRVVDGISNLSWAKNWRSDHEKYGMAEIWFIICPCHVSLTDPNLCLIRISATPLSLRKRGLSSIRVHLDIPVKFIKANSHKFLKLNSLIKMIVNLRPDA